jgi:hypothetical protein
MPLICRGTTRAPCLLGLQCCDAFLDSLSLGPYVFQVDLPGLRLGPEFAQVGFQLGDALCSADELPPKAMSVFRTVTVVYMAAMMLTRAMTATTAVSLAAALAAASFLLARALAATFAACLLAVAAVPTFTMAAVSTATPFSTITSAMFAHRLYPPVLIWNCCSYRARNRSN